MFWPFDGSMLRILLFQVIIGARDMVLGTSVAREMQAYAPIGVNFPHPWSQGVSHTSSQTSNLFRRRQFHHKDVSASCI